MKTNITPADVALMAELRHAGMNYSEIAAVTGFNPQSVRDYVNGIRIAPPVIRQMACQTDDEWQLWKDAALTLISPCEECPLGFAADMRAIGRCDGVPAGVEAAA